MKGTYIGIGIAAVVVIAALVFGFFSAGSPWAVRGYKLDSTRISDFGSIESAVQEYYYSKMQLPDSLATLASSSSNYYLSASTFKDPETQQAYDYKVTDTTHYQLCATFFASSQDEQQYNNSYYYGTNASNQHKQGYDCVTYSVTGSGYNYGPYPVQTATGTPTSTTK